MRNIKAREIKTIALTMYKPEWLKRGVTLKNFYKQLKKEYVRGNYNGIQNKK